MDWHTLLAALIGSGGASCVIWLAWLHWLKTRSTTYLDAAVVEKIKSYHAEKIEELKNEQRRTWSTSKAILLLELNTGSPSFPYTKSFGPLWESSKS